MELWIDLSLVDEGDPLLENQRENKAMLWLVPKMCESCNMSLTVRAGIVPAR